ncbi:hypothetical protein [Maribacter forsetii]|uniref:hypothetical protein n=1 Tax=Maribacter forsetii TaxID=444515 RepID=UPI00056B4599|nr:hypothetical protein [Maribacter forsetii]
MTYLDESINDEVQNLMIDVFEAIKTSQEVTLSATELLATQSILENIFEKVKTTGFYNEDENFKLVKAMNIDTDGQNAEEALFNCWGSMVKTINTAASQEEFNAKFALFVPILLKRMTVIDQVVE